MFGIFSHRTPSSFAGTAAPVAGIVVLALLPALCGAAQTRPFIEPATQPARRFARVELTIRGVPPAQNPFDPAEIEVNLRVRSPSGRSFAVPAFCYQPFEHRRADRGGRQQDWLYPVGEPQWKARLAPAEPGTYRCAAMVTHRGRTAESDEISFQCLPSDSRGFVRVSRKDPRYLELDDGSPFFAVGQNIAFIHELSTGCEMIRRFGAAGGNYARVWACCEDWAMAIEARKSAFGRSWSWNPPLVAMPDRDGYHRSALCIKLTSDGDARLSLNPAHPVALRPGTKYRFSGAVRSEAPADVVIELPGGARTIAATRQWRQFAEEFAAGSGQWWLGNPVIRLAGKSPAYLRGLSLREAAGGPELLWEADPDRPPLGVYNHIDSFMLDRIVETAEQAGVYLQIVLLTRDHYMHMLRRDDSRDYDRAIAAARNLLRYAVARWGYSVNVAAWEYFNEQDPGLPTDRFYDELGAFLEQIDINRHIRCTSTWSSPSKDYRHPRLDTADHHYYMRPSTGDLFKDEVASVLSRWKHMQQHCSGRPIMFSEFGLADDKWQRAPETPRDAEYLHLHNALWASAMSGFAGTVCAWWWEEIHRRDMYRHYRPLAAFVADIPFTTAGFAPASASADRGLRIVGLQGRNQACLWINDPASTWWNVAINGVKPPTVSGASLTVENLPAGTYRVIWFDTWQGKTLQQQTAASDGRTLRAAIADFSRDIACRIVP